jgi:hypothetical protein
MSIGIRVVETTCQAEAVFRLRYEVYVEELQRVQFYADRAGRMIREALDQDAILLGAFAAERALGSLRINYARRSELGEYVDLYQMESGGVQLANASIVTKLVVVPELRGSSLAYRLASEAYRTGLRDGILHNFIDVYPERIPFFERLGYRVHVPLAVHAEFGQVVVMRLDMRDEAHLRRVGSPFLRHLELEEKAA